MSEAALVVAAAPPLVSREAERARVEAFVDQLPSGFRSLHITGQPGIGKSALWRDGVERCRRAGFQVLVARPAEEEMPLALVGLVDLFEPVAPSMAAIEQDDPLARGRSVLELLHRLAEDAPVVVAIDDLQWLDPASVRALRYALRRLDTEQVGLLTTFRPGADPDRALSAAPESGRSETLGLGPLGLDALRQVLGGTVAAISRPQLRRIHEASGGNPLYAIELARGLDEAGAEAGRLRLTDSLQATIARRLETVADELTALLETVSALGRTPVEDLRAILSGADLDRLLTCAADEGLLVRDGRLVRFAHPLVGAAVYGRMSPLERRSLHARLAALATDPDLRARHVALSTSEPDECAAALLEQAGLRASGRGAFDLASELTGHSLRLTPPEEPEADLRRALAEIESCAAAGEATRALELADRLVSALPPGPARAEALIQRAHLQDDDLERGEAFLLRALEDAGEEEPLRGRVLDLLGWLRGMFRGDLRGGIACAREAVAIAERVPDPGFRMLALAGLAHMETLAGGRPSGTMERAVELEREIGQPPLWMGPRRLLAKQLVWAGDLEGARALFEAVHADATGSGSERHRPYVLYDRALVASAAGDFAAAERAVRAGIEAARDGENSHIEAWFLYPLASIDAWLGRATEARAAADALLRWSTSRGDRIDAVRSYHLRGLVALSEGDAALAAPELAQAVRLLGEIGVGHPGAFPVLPDAIEACACEGDLDSVEALLERLERQTAEVDSVWASAAVERCRGVLLLARGDGAAAAGPLEDAVARFDRLGYTPDAARALLLRGRALLRAGRRSQAAAALSAARARFVEMGAALWEARAADELERTPGRGAGELTPTERRIAGLVADGLRNREIGQALFVSVATVEAHLTRIYRKLGIRSRSELTRLVADGGIGARPERVGETR